MSTSPISSESDPHHNIVWEFGLDHSYGVERRAGKAAFAGIGSAAVRTETPPHPGSSDPAVEDLAGVLGQHLAGLGIVAEHGEQPRRLAFDRGHPVEGIAAAEQDQGFPRPWL